MKNSCNQCHEQLKIVDIILYVEEPHDVDRVFGACISPACPNYGIVQVPAEAMSLEEK
jgi:hypothetical protein